MSHRATRPTRKIADTVPYRPPRRRGAWTWFALGVTLALLMVVLAGIVGYITIAMQLPPAEELRQRSHQFATTQILDREGNLLWEIIDPTGGRRTHIALDQVAPELIQATLATEDRFFYINVGVDPIAIVRALYTNLSEQQIVSGASTITQQLARDVFLTPEERTERTVARKLKEAVLAVEIDRRYSKDQILEIYLNQIYYGNLAYGIEAAAQTYFGKSATALTVAEATMLAGLPQSPAVYNPYQNPVGAKRRQGAVIGLMVEAGYLTAAEAEAVLNTPVTLRPPDLALDAPHFVGYVREELERTVPPAYIYQAGLRVYTTLDPTLQALAEQAVAEGVDALAPRNVSNGALVALDVENGQIVAFVGSRDFLNEGIDGQVNLVTSPRQPGSTIKPLTYLAAFETLNWTPSTLLMDTPVEYPDENGVYRPTNIDLAFHGPVSVRSALANSYNVPAVKALEQVGVSRLKAMAARLGISTLSGDAYGLSLTLGSGEVSLMEMTNAYQALANQGQLIDPSAILKITDNFGRAVEPLRPPPRPVINPAHAYLITDILADHEARHPGYGEDNLLELSRPAAAKTGTTSDFRDSWTIGYTPDLVAGVWMGNANNRPMDEVGGIVGAAPIWHGFMEAAHAERPVREFPRPGSIVQMEICADSGTIPSPVCPERRWEIFYERQPPLGPEHDLHQLVEVDFNSGLLVNEYCRSNVGQRYYQVFPPEARAWALAQGIEQPPTQYCPSTNLVARLTYPPDTGAVRGLMPIKGVAIANNFDYYQLELGLSTEAEEFIVIQGPTRQLVDNDLLATLDTTQLPNGPYTLRLVVFDSLGGFTDDRIRLLIDNAGEGPPVGQPITTPPASPWPTVTPLPSPSISEAVITDAINLPPVPAPTTP